MNEQLELFDVPRVTLAIEVALLKDRQDVQSCIPYDDTRSRRLASLPLHVKSSRLQESSREVAILIFYSESNAK